MVGPVLTHELLLANRRTRLHVFRWCYGGWLVLQFAFLLLALAIQLAVPFYDPRTIFSDAATNYLQTLVGQHFLLLLLATPAITAGAITDEKARGTLHQLLISALRPWEILSGKLFARGCQVLALALTVLPLLCFFGPFGGLDLPLLGVLVILTLAIVFGVGAMSLLASVLCRHTRDAVLGLYAVLLAVWLVAAGMSGWPRALLDGFDPVMPLDNDWLFADAGDLSRRLFKSVISWSVLGVLCLLLAAWQLRPAYLRYLEGRSRKRLRWWHGGRPRIKDTPVRWKERYVEGIAPVAFFRFVPSWLGVMLAAAAGVYFSGAIFLWQMALTFSDLWDMIVTLDVERFAEATTLFSPSGGWEFCTLGFFVMLLVGTWIGIRCSGAITSERERGTWESLLLTPLETRELVRGKFWGILGAAWPYLIAYAVPTLVLSVLSGWFGILWTPLWLAITVLAMAYAGAAGIWCSARSRTSWRSLLGTLGFVYASGVVVYCVGSTLIGVLLLAGYLLLTFVAPTLGYSAAYTTGFMAVLLLIVCLVLVGFFIVTTIFLLRYAERRVGDLERAWDGTMERPRRRPGERLKESRQG